MRYFISYIGTYSGGKIAAGNMIVRTPTKINDKTNLRKIESFICETNHLDNAAVMSYKEIET